MRSSSEVTLSICLPTNRNLADCKTSLESILSFARSRSCEIVVSDNSGDMSKKAFFKGYEYPNLVYVEGPSGGAENWWNAVQHARGDFIGCISDDDHLAYIPDAGIKVPEGCVGLRPSFVLWDAGHGCTRLTNFSINDNMAVNRVTSYFRLNGGANSTLFSFWRADQFRRTMRLQLQHPTRLGYQDWAIVLSLIAIGPLISLPDSLLIYNLHNWSTPVQAGVSLRKMFTEGGFKPEFSKYVPLLLGIDAFVFIMRHDNGLAREEKLEAAVVCLSSYLRTFKHHHDSRGLTGATPTEQRLFGRLSGTMKLAELFSWYMDFFDSMSPTLGEGYRKFWETSTLRSWGDY